MDLVYLLIPFFILFCDFYFSVFYFSETLVLSAGGKVEAHAYRCPYCDNVFTHKGKLNRHIRSHFGLKAHECPWPHCRAKFVEKYNLNRHIRLLHGAT